MPATHKGVTIPAPSDTADAPQAFKNFIDGGGAISRVASAAKPASPVEGQIIYNLTDRRFEHWNGSAWVGLLVPKPKDYWFWDATNSLTNTTFATIFNHLSMVVAPYDVRMVVSITGRAGFGGNPTQVDIRVRDSAGAEFGPNIEAARSYPATQAGWWSTVAIQCYKDFSAGQTCGFKVDALCGPPLGYSAATNYYVALTSRVQFVPA